MLLITCPQCACLTRRCVCVVPRPGLLCDCRRRQRRRAQAVPAQRRPGVHRGALAVALGCECFHVLRARLECLLTFLCCLQHEADYCVSAASFAAHSGWISAVQFVSDARGGGGAGGGQPSLCLSSAGAVLTPVACWGLQWCSKPRCRRRATVSLEHAGGHPRKHSRVRFTSSSTQSLVVTLPCFARFQVPGARGAAAGAEPAARQGHLFHARARQGARFALGCFCVVCWLVRLTCDSDSGRPC